MEILGQLGDKVYVADLDYDVLYATTSPDETVELVGGGRTTPEQFLKFNGAYLTDLADDRDEDKIIDAVERDADGLPPPLPPSGTPPARGALTYVAGAIWPNDDIEVRVLTAEPGQPAATTSVWLEGDPDLVTTKAEIDARWSAGWFEIPPPA